MKFSALRLWGRPGDQNPLEIVAEHEVPSKLKDATPISSPADDGVLDLGLFPKADDDLDAPAQEEVWTGPATTIENDAKAEALLAGEPTSAEVIDTPEPDARENEPHPALNDRYSRHSGESLLGVLSRKAREQAASLSQSVMGIKASLTARNNAEAKVTLDKPASQDSERQIDAKLAAYTTAATIGLMSKRVGASLRQLSNSLKDAMSAATPDFKSGAAAAMKNLGEVGDSISQNTRQKTASLLEKVNNARRSLSNPDTYKAIAKGTWSSLKNPETYKNGAKDAVLGAAIMMPTKYIVGTALLAHGAPALAALAGVTATTSAIRGLMKSNKQYNEARAAFEMNEANKGEQFQSRFDYLRTHKKQYLSNVFKSVAGSAVGAGIAHFIDLGSIFDHHGTAPAPSNVGLGEIVPDSEVANAIPVETVQTTAFPMPKTDLDKAIDLLQARPDLTEQMKASIADAKLNHAQGIKDIAYYINTDGVASDDHLIDGILAQVKEHTAHATKTVVESAPHHNSSAFDAAFGDSMANIEAQADIESAPVPEPASVNPVPSVPVGSSSVSTAAKIGLGVVGTTATVAGGLAGAEALAARSLGTPQEPARLRELVPAEQTFNRPPHRILNVCRVNDTKNQSQDVEIICPTIPLQAEAHPGDGLKIDLYQNSTKVASEIVELGGTDVIPVKSSETSMGGRREGYEESLFNSSHFTSVLARLRGAAAARFNRSSSDISVPAVANDDRAPKSSLQFATVAPQ